MLGRLSEAHTSPMNGSGSSAQLSTELIDGGEEQVLVGAVEKVCGTPMGGCRPSTQLSMLPRGGDELHALLGGAEGELSFS